MLVETVKVSSKGQLVIPQDVRDKLHIEEGTVFALLTDKDTILLKRIRTPTRENLVRELEHMAASGKKRLQQSGFNESDLLSNADKTRHG